MAALANLLRRGECPAENDRHAVAIGAGDEARYRTAGAHRLLVDVVDCRLRGAVGIGLRHEGGDLLAPDAPQLAGIGFVAAVEPAVEHLDRDVFLVVDAGAHRRLDQGVERAELVLRQAAQAAFKADVFGQGDERERRRQDGGHAERGENHETGLNAESLPTRDHDAPVRRQDRIGAGAKVCVTESRCLLVNNIRPADGSRAAETAATARAKYRASLAISISL